jgi:periplasmic divalent cation tolerance protein
MRCLQVATSVGSREEAERLAAPLVRERLAACVQTVGPIRSTYWWKGEVETAEEWLCLIKTTDARYPALEARIKALHSYDVPEITAVEIAQGSADYLGWIAAET